MASSQVFEIVCVVTYFPILSLLSLGLFLGQLLLSLLGLGRLFFSGFIFLFL